MYLTDPPCPACGHRGSYVGTQLTVRGPAYVAGMMTKLSATDVLVWRCASCDAYGTAHPPPGFVFDDGAAATDEGPTDTGRADEST